MSVSASIGPISGIDYGSLITGLTSLEQQPINQIGTRINSLDQQNNALLGVSALLTGLKVSAASFTSSAIFRAATATAADPTVINATAGIGTPVGNYNFNVQRLASASQQVTQGFSSSTAAARFTGNYHSPSSAEVNSMTMPSSAPSTASGRHRGSIRITDKAAGNSTLAVDLSNAVDIADVVDRRRTRHRPQRLRQSLITTI